MSRLLKDPLLHFLLLGGLLFAFLSSREAPTEPTVIRVDAEQIERLARTQLVLDGGELKPESIDALVESFVRDEIYYREALALGLDVEDDQVRTRLIEKMRYLTENLADPEPASEAELHAFFDANPALFLQPATVTFDQVFFSPSQRGGALAGDVETGLARLRAGASPHEVGDRTPLGSRFEDAPADRLRVLFGEPMTAAIFAAPLGEWIGPYESDFGLHVVRVSGQTAARQPEFEEARASARDIYAEARRRARNDAAFEAMRSRYEVIVERPDDREAN